MIHINICILQRLIMMRINLFIPQRLTVMHINLFIPQRLTVLCFLFHSQGGAQNKARPDADSMVWSGSSSRDVGFGYSESSVTITVGEDTGASAPEKKEVPIWMQKSTVKGIPLMDGGDSLVCPCFFLRNTSLTPCRKFRSHYLGMATAVLPILTSV